MAWTAPFTATVGQIITADDWNEQIRDDLRHLRGLDGTTELVNGVLMTGTGTASFHRPPALTQAQADALTGTIPGRFWWNTTKNEGEVYGTAQEEMVTVPGTAARGDVISRDANGWAVLSSAAQGDVFYAAANGDLTRLTAGVSGRFLQTQGGAANPQWAAQVSATDSGTYVGNGTAQNINVGYRPKFVMVMRVASPEFYLAIDGTRNLLLRSGELVSQGIDMLINGSGFQASGTASNSGTGYNWSAFG